jgi:hypothetical protein
MSFKSNIVGAERSHVTGGAIRRSIGGPRGIGQEHSFAREHPSISHFRNERTSNPEGQHRFSDSQSAHEFDLMISVQDLDI